MNVKIIMVEGNRYSIKGKVINVGDVVAVTEDMAGYLLKQETSEGHAYFEMYDDTKVTKVEKKPEMTIPKTAADFKALLDEAGIGYPTNATLGILKALYKKSQNAETADTGEKDLVGLDDSSKKSDDADVLGDDADIL